MIEYDWPEKVVGDTREELAGLLAEAAEADAEAGFPSFALADPVPAATRYLLVWLLPDDRDGHSDSTRTLAGCLRLEPLADAAGAAEARIVIHPGYRSRGITVLLCERLGLDTRADGGWAGTGFTRLHCWARGNHPAAQRLALRFGGPGAFGGPATFGVPGGAAGLRRTRREWRLVVPLSRDADLETLAGVRELPADVVTELRERADQSGYDVEPLLDKALTGLREDGALIGSIVVDDGQHTLLVACRTLGFRHDRTDARYDLG